MNQHVFNVREFGASGAAVRKEILEIKQARFKWVDYEVGAKFDTYGLKEGAPLDSIGIQKAIDAAHAQGGGMVLVPPGDYLIGPLELRSHVRLHLEAGAKLYGSPHIEDYAVPAGRQLPVYTLAKGYNRESEGLTREKLRLISAYRSENFGITGQGSICAQSPAFVIPWLNSNPKDLLSLHRPQDTILFFECTDIFLEDFALRDAPSWCMVLDCCREVRIDGVCIHGFDMINSDGIDLVNTSDATISNCRIHCTDDAICLKNTVRGATMKNITVSNCIIRTLCNAFKTGTDSMGSFEDITVDNLVMHGDDGQVGDRGGINLCALDGGRVRNVNISNLVMKNVFCPFYLYATARTPQQKAMGLEPSPGQMERISITNVWADGTRYPCYIVGHPDAKVADVHVANINVYKSKDFREGPPSAPVPELPDEYPTPFTFGSRDIGDELPASGLYLRNVADSVVRDFRMRFMQPDGRDLIVTEHCEGVEITGAKKYADCAGRPAA